MSRQKEIFHTDKKVDLSRHNNETVCLMTFKIYQTKIDTIRALDRALALHMTIMVQYPYGPLTAQGVIAEPEVSPGYCQVRRMRGR